MRCQAIIRRAGLEPWPGLFQILRRDGETDWARAYRPYVVRTWAGHDIVVESEFYLRVPQEVYDRASELTVAPTSELTSHAARDGSGPHAGLDHLPPMGARFAAQTVPRNPCGTDPGL